jgi:hypothetical protein
MYNPQTMTQSTRTSSVSWSTTSRASHDAQLYGNLSQNMRDSSIAMTLPDLNFSISRSILSPRANTMWGQSRWYEKISMSYTGSLSNSILPKEDMLITSPSIYQRLGANGMQH